MKTYAIKVSEIHSETFLIEADDVEEAIRKAEEYNENVGFCLDEITDMEYKESPLSNADGTATEDQLKYCERLEDC